MTRRPSPELFPPGRVVEVPGVGPTFVRHLAGPPGAPTLVLLHGWASSADITWHGVFAPLAGRFSVLAPDLRGHSGGPRNGPVVDIGDVAGDVSALLEELDAGPVIAVGYSLGGAVAQLLARRRPDLVAGMVLCASACRLAATPAERLRLRAMRLAGHVAAALPDVVSAGTAEAVMRVMYGGDDFQRWVLSISRHHRWSNVLALGAALEGFDSRPWIGDVRVPAAVVVTGSDRFISAERQRWLAGASGAAVFEIEGDHGVCLSAPDRFAATLIEACTHVATAGLAALHPLAPTEAGSDSTELDPFAGGEYRPA